MNTVMDCNYLTDVFQSVACMFFREQALTNVLKGHDFHNRGPAACGQKHLHRHCPAGQDCSGKSCLYRQRYGYRHSAGCVSLACGYEDIACSGNDNIPCLTGKRQSTRSIPHISLPSQLPSPLPSMRREASRLYTAHSIHRPAINYSLLTVNYSLNDRRSSAYGQKHLHRHCPAEQDCSGKSCLYRQRYGYRHSAGCVSLACGYEDIACSGNDNIPCLTGKRQLTRSISHVSLPSQLPSMLPSMRREASRLYTAHSIHRPAINYSLFTINYSLNKSIML